MNMNYFSELSYAIIANSGMPHTHFLFSGDYWRSVCSWSDGIIWL